MTTAIDFRRSRPLLPTRLKSDRPEALDLSAMTLSSTPAGSRSRSPSTHERMAGPMSTAMTTTTTSPTITLPPSSSSPARPVHTRASSSSNRLSAGRHGSAKALQTGQSSKYVVGNLDNELVPISPSFRRSTSQQVSVNGEDWTPASSLPSKSQPLAYHSSGNVLANTPNVIHGTCSQPQLPRKTDARPFKPDGKVSKQILESAIELVPYQRLQLDREGRYRQATQQIGKAYYGPQRTSPAAANLHIITNPQATFVENRSEICLECTLRDKEMEDVSPTPSEQELEERQLAIDEGRPWTNPREMTAHARDRHRIKKHARRKTNGSHPLAEAVLKIWTEAHPPEPGHRSRAMHHYLLEQVETCRPLLARSYGASSASRATTEPVPPRNRKEASARATGLSNTRSLLPAMRYESPALTTSKSASFVNLARPLSVLNSLNLNGSKRSESPEFESAKMPATVAKVNRPPSKERTRFSLFLNTIQTPTFAKGVASNGDETYGQDLARRDDSLPPTPELESPVKSVIAAPPFERSNSSRSSGLANVKSAEQTSRRSTAGAKRKHFVVNDRKELPAVPFTGQRAPGSRLSSIHQKEQDYDLAISHQVSHLTPESSQASLPKPKKSSGLLRKLKLAFTTPTLGGVAQSNSRPDRADEAEDFGVEGRRDSQSPSSQNGSEDQEPLRPPPRMSQLLGTFALPPDAAAPANGASSGGTSGSSTPLNATPLGKPKSPVSHARNHARTDSLANMSVGGISTAVQLGSEHAAPSCLANVAGMRPQMVSSISEPSYLSQLASSTGSGPGGRSLATGSPLKASPVESVGRLSIGGGSSLVQQQTTTHTPSTDVTNPDSTFLNTNDKYLQNELNHGATGFFHAKRNASPDDRSDSYFLARDVDSSNEVIQDETFENGLPGGRAEIWETPLEINASQHRVMA